MSRFVKRRVTREVADQSHGARVTEDRRSDDRNTPEGFQHQQISVAGDDHVGATRSAISRRRVSKQCQPTRSPSQNGGKVVTWRRPELWIAATDELIEVAV